MPVPNSVQRALLANSAAGCRQLVALTRSSSGGSGSNRRAPLAHRTYRTRVLQRMASSSASSREKASSRSASSSSMEAAHERPAQGRRRCADTTTPRRYIPSDYRGVVGGPKGKWKASIVSKGGLRKLGTFGCEVEAARAYNQAARTLHGSAAKLNLLPDEAAEEATTTRIKAGKRVATQGTEQESTSVLEEGGSEKTAHGNLRNAEDRSVHSSSNSICAGKGKRKGATKSSAAHANTTEPAPTESAPTPAGKSSSTRAETLDGRANVKGDHEVNNHQDTAPPAPNPTPVPKPIPTQKGMVNGGVNVKLNREVNEQQDTAVAGTVVAASLNPAPVSPLDTFAQQDTNTVAPVVFEVVSAEDTGNGGVDPTGAPESYSAAMVDEAASVTETVGGAEQLTTVAVNEPAPAVDIAASTVNEAAINRVTETAGNADQSSTVVVNDSATPVDIAAEDFFAAELSFRDLEELPVTVGPSFWEDADGTEATLFAEQQKMDLGREKVMPSAITQPIDLTGATTSIDRNQVIATRDQESALPLAKEGLDASNPAPTAAVAGSDWSTEYSAEQSTGWVSSYSSATASSIPPAERPAAGDASSLRPPLEEAGEAADVLKPATVSASVRDGWGAVEDWEEFRQDGFAAGGEAALGEVGREAWLHGAAAEGGVAGWERDTTGEEFYQDRLKEVVDVSTGLDRYWMEPLMGLTKPEARKVAMQLSNANKLGYVSTRGGPVSKGSLLEFVLAQKEKHPTKVLLTRVGEFYETYGVDAVMMMQHAGLNKMGQEVRAGCPRKNVQQTLDGLTGAGLTVAVYEEMNDVDAQRGPSARTRIKERTLTQVLSPGSPNYLYEGCLRTDDISFRESKPYVGVMRDSSGYLLCQIYTDEREVQVSERLTEEAVRVSMEEAGVAEPVFDQGTGLSFLPDHTEQLTGFATAAFPGQVLARVARLLELATSDLDHFRTVTRSTEGRPRAVYPSTALQIGLLRNSNVPDLVPCLLPAGYPAACHRFLRKWLLLPPSYRLADSAHELCKQLASPSQTGLPPLHAVPVGKAKALLLDRQCNVPFFREIHQCTRGMLDMLGQHESPQIEAQSRTEFPTSPGNSLAREDPDAILTGGRGEGVVFNEGSGMVGDGALSSPTTAAAASMAATVEGPYSLLVPHLLELVAYQSGVEAVEGHLRERARAVIDAIEAVVAANNGADEITSDTEMLVPDTFWRNNEANFRGSLSLEHEATKRAYKLLDTAASELCKAVKEDFPNAAQDLSFDLHNNAVHLTKLPPNASVSSLSTPSSSKSSNKKRSSKEDGGGGYEGEEAAKTAFINPYDRNGKLLTKRFTTHRVAAAMSAYLSCVQDTESTVKLELQALSDSLVSNNDLPVIAQAAHWSVICQSLEGHVRRSLASGWALPTLKAVSDDDMTMQVQDLVPYWLPRGEAVPNSFDFRGLFLLTAPNMSGKSTLMRAVLASSLLGNAGLFTPCTSAVIPRYDGFFLRTASYDIPAEDKSAFALEMDDVRVMLRDSSSRSLALVDELGKGTSARDGAALAGALLEEMDRVSISGIFATHLHELFDLPLKTNTLSCKRMGIDWRDGDNPSWTYKMEDGKCTNSLALQTARRYNIPSSIIARAEALSLAFDHICRGSGLGDEDGLAASRVDTAMRPARAGQASTGVQASAELQGDKGRNGGGGEAWDEDGTHDRGEGWWPSEGRGWGGYGSGGSRSMEDAAEVMQAVTRCPAGGIVFVDSGYSTPPALEGRSCLYVLRYSTPAGPTAPSAVAVAPRRQGEHEAGRIWGVPLPRRPSGDNAEADDIDGDTILQSSPALLDEASRVDSEERVDARGWSAARAGLGTTGDQMMPESAQGGEQQGLEEGYAFTDASTSIDKGPRVVGNSESGVWFYVGESDAIRERLRQHQLRWGVRADGMLSSQGDSNKLDAMMVAVENKSDARWLETCLIRAMKEKGFHLVSDRDGSRVNFASPPPSP